MAVFLSTATLRAAPPEEPSDPALIPVTPTPGYYPDFPQGWANFHQLDLEQAAKHKGPLDLLLLGDSITAGWGNRLGEPQPEHAAVWGRYFGAYAALNFGIGGDKTQNVLWRIEHGEVDGLEPRAVVLAIGVNNLFNFTVPLGAIAAGVEKCVEELQAKFPQAELIVVDLFPHEESPTNLGRKRGDDARAAIRALGLEKRPRVHELDLAARFLQPDGTLVAALFMPDHLHLSTAGYEVYAQGLAPVVAQLLGAGHP